MRAESEAPVPTITKPDVSSRPTADTLVARARGMIPTVAGRAAEARRERRMSKETIRDMEAAGFFRILQPARWGGYEMKPQVFYDVLLALAEGDMSAGWVYGVLGVHPWLMGLMEDRAVHDVWGDDDTTRLCSSLMPVGRAEPVEGGFQLSGRWRFSSGCDYARWALLGAVVRTEPSVAPDIRLFMVPDTEYKISDTWFVSGLCATGSQDILVSEAFVPSYRTRRMIDNFKCVGAGQTLNTSPLYKIPFGQIFFRGVSSPSIGALQAMLNSFISYARQRSGAAGKSTDDPVAQQICAEVVAAIDEMKLVLDRNLTTLWHCAEQGDPPTMDVRHKFKFQSATVSHRCAELAARLVRATGAAGIYDEQPFGQLLADINAGRQHIANQFEMIGRNWGTAILGGIPRADMMI
jgi:3-hydroxy-9,10-secoandrosta-1,3,5(10)-triene-9,17-dione monooxygenase